MCCSINDVFLLSFIRFVDVLKLLHIVSVFNYSKLTFKELFSLLSLNMCVVLYLSMGIRASNWCWRCDGFEWWSKLFFSSQGWTWINELLACCVVFAQSVCTELNNAVIPQLKRCFGGSFLFCFLQAGKHTGTGKGGRRWFNQPHHSKRCRTRVCVYVCVCV